MRHFLKGVVAHQSGPSGSTPPLAAVPVVSKTSISTRAVALPPVNHQELEMPLLPGRGRACHFDAPCYISSEILPTKYNKGHQF